MNDGYKVMIYNQQLLFYMKSLWKTLFGQINPSFIDIFHDLTAPNSSCLSKQKLKEMMEILSGDCPTIRAQIAFAKLLDEISKSQTKNNELFQLKSVLLLDRIVEEGLFCKEISLIPVSIYFAKIQDGEKILFGLRIRILVHTFWQLVGYIARIQQSKSHVICFKRSQRVQYIQSLSIKQVGNQLKILESLFRVAFQVSKQLKRVESESEQVELIQSMVLNLAHKLLVYYACEMQCFQTIIPQLINCDENQLKMLAKSCKKLQSNSFQFMKYLKIFKTVKGLEQFNFQQLNPFQNNTLPQMIATLLREYENKSHQSPRQCSIMRRSTIKVYYHPFSDVDLKKPLHARVKFPQQIRKQQENPFLDWNNSFSDSFPQRQIMTLDLILQIRKQQQTKKPQIQFDISKEGEFYMGSSKLIQDEQPYNEVYSVDLSKTSKIYGNFQLSFIHPSQQNIIFFSNIYSSIPEKWNDQQ